MAAIKLTPIRARAALLKIMKAGLVPMMHGSPAIGKSAMVHSVAKQFDLKLIDLRLSQADPTDLLGFPKIVGDRGGYVPMDSFPIAGDELPAKVDANNKPIIIDGVVQKYKGWLLFLDELPLASAEVQKAAYKLILDRMVGNHHLHIKVAMVAAGNLETDGSLVEPMSQALRSRMTHIEVVPDFAEWSDWAQSPETNIDFRIISYLNARKENFYKFNGDSDAYTYPAPRTWMAVDAVLKQDPIVRSDDLITKAVISGSVGEGVGPEFMMFCEIENELPTFKAIMANPETVTLPTRIDALWMVSGMVGKEIDASNLDTVGKFVKRLPVEFQVTTLRGAVKRDLKLMTNPTILAWIAEAAATKF